MIKSRLGIIGTLLVVSATVMAAGPQDCRSFLKVINNDSRMEVPLIKEFLSRNSVENIFDKITLYNYDEGRIIQSVGVRSSSDKGLLGERASAGRHTNYLATLFIHTAGESPEFPTKSSFIPENSRAYLGLQLRVVPSMGRPKEAGTVPSQELIRLSTATIDQMFGDEFFHKDMLNERDLRRLLQESAEIIGPTSLLHDSSRLGRYRRTASGQVEIQINLDSLSFAEFYALLNALVGRLQELSAPPF